MIFKMTTPLLEPLNLEYLFMNVLAGSDLIFLGLFIIAIATLAARMKMPNYIFGFMLVIGVLILQYIVSYSWVSTLVLLITGFIVYFVWGKLIK